MDSKSDFATSRRQFIQSSAMVSSTLLSLHPIAGASPKDSPFWHKAMAKPAKEFSQTPLKILAGSIPEGIEGSLYRNGPGRIKRGDTTVGHWFDGDGALLQIQIANGMARGAYKFIQTEKYIAEEKSGQYIYPGLGTMPPGKKFWNRSILNIKSPANTSVLATEDKILALWEGDYPYSIDPLDLSTIGPDNLGGFLDQFGYFPAHPKVDPATGEILCFSIPKRALNKLNLFIADMKFNLLRHKTIELPHKTFIHDMAITDQYFIFCVMPLEINLLPAMAGIKNYFDCVQWSPSKGNHYLVIDRNTLDIVHQIQGQSHFHWHLSHARRDGNQIKFTAVAYDNFDNHNRWLGEVPSGKTKTYGNQGTLREITLDLDKETVASEEQVMDFRCEFPVEDLRNNHMVYLNSYQFKKNQPEEIFDSICSVDLRSGKTKVAAFGTGYNYSEPIYVQDKYLKDRGWILTVVYSSADHSSMLMVYDADHLDADPVAIAALPEVIPPSFHGKFLPHS